MRSSNSEKHLDAMPSLEELAGVACFSPFHFHRLFKSLVGESVAAYVRRLRLERAAHQVSYSTASVLDMALDAGYESPEVLPVDVQIKHIPTLLVACLRHVGPHDGCGPTHRLS